MSTATKSYASSDRISAFWESEKSSPCIVPRVLRITIDQMCINAGVSDDCPVYLAIRMHASSKRTLRSQQIVVPERGSVFNHPIRVEIQYPHAIKRDNPLLIMLQRRKKYKNLGFKTLGVAQVNLSDVLQCRLVHHQLDLLPESSLKTSADQSSASVGGGGGQQTRQQQQQQPPPQPVGFVHVTRLETLPPQQSSTARELLLMGGSATQASSTSRKDFPVPGGCGTGIGDDDEAGGAGGVSDEDETDPADDEEEEEKVMMKKDAFTKPREWRQKFKLFMDENFSTILKPKKVKGGQQFELDYQPDLQNESLWNDLDDAEPDSDSSLDDGDELSVQSTPKPSLRRYFGSQASDCGQPLASAEQQHQQQQQQQQHPNLLHPTRPEHHQRHQHYHHHQDEPEQAVEPQLHHHHHHQQLLQQHHQQHQQQQQAGQHTRSSALAPPENPISDHQQQPFLPVPIPARQRANSHTPVPIVAECPASQQPHQQHHHHHHYHFGIRRHQPAATDGPGGRRGSLNAAVASAASADCCLQSTVPRKECLEAAHRLLGDGLPERLCIVSTVEPGGRAMLDALQSPDLPCIPASSAADCRHVMSHVLSGLGHHQQQQPAQRHHLHHQHQQQQTPPALHRICLLGSDQLANSVLRAYVEQFASRPATWQARVRFHYAPLPAATGASSLLARYLTACDPSGYGQLFGGEDWRECQPGEAVRRIRRYLLGAVGLLGLPIGEVMLATGASTSSSSAYSSSSVSAAAAEGEGGSGTGGAAGGGSDAASIAQATSVGAAALAATTFSSTGASGFAGAGLAGPGTNSASGEAAAGGGVGNDNDAGAQEAQQEAQPSAAGGGGCPGAQTFVPFIVGVRIGTGADAGAQVSLVAAPPHPDSDGEPQQQQQQSPGLLHTGTPPQSPSLNLALTSSTAAEVAGAAVVSPAGGSSAPGGSEFVDLQLDYWTTAQERKTSLKPAARALYITRLMSQPASAGLVMTLVNKEKRQKIMRLGKKGKELENRREIVDNLTRLICTSKSQSHPMKVVVDGVDWPGVKFFQLSSQWQTNVKQMPMAVFLPSGHS